MFASEIGRVLSVVVGLPGLLRGIIMNVSSASTLVFVVNVLLYMCVSVFDNVEEPYFKYSPKILSAPAARPLVSFVSAFSVYSSLIGSSSGVGVVVLSNGGILA